MGTNIILRYLQGKTNETSVHDTINRIFEYNLMVIIPEFFITVREFEHGLAFAENMLSTIEEMRPQQEDYIYQYRLQTVLLMKFEMLDRLNMVKEYLDLFDEILDSEDPRYIEPYPRSDITYVNSFFVVSRDDDGFYLNFLYQVAWRQEIMLRKWQRFTSGRPIGNQLRHQKDRLTNEQLVRRADAYFDRYKHTYLAGVMH